MGLFGKKKSKTSTTVADPPAADAGHDMVKVASISDASEEETPYVEHKDSGSVGEENKSKIDEIKEKLSDHTTAFWATFLGLWFSLSKTTQVAAAAGAAVGSIAVIALVAAGGHTPALPAHINVAFVGNSYFYVNDLPRTIEQMGNGHITQDSVIRNNASILQIIMGGNGMWNTWATTKAMANGVEFEDSQGETKYLYDMGACSVPQLLTGHDDAITYKNNAGTFNNDYQNPCFQQEAYREYQESTKRTKWDFVVITDQSKRMAFEDTRESALMAFDYTYGPILKKYHISPVIVQPHAYSSSSSGLDDLTTFTALVMEGANYYKNYLNRRVGFFAHAIVAPVGNAYLAVYEESPSDLWPKLFLDDGIHPSAHGTFLYGLVIYATMTGHMPKYKHVVVEDMENSDIFGSARRLQATGTQAGFPTKDEADVLYKIAKKVALSGYKPKSMRSFKTSTADSSFLRSDGSNNVYSGGNGNGQQYNQYNDNADNANYNNDDANADYYQENDGEYQNYNNGNYDGSYGGDYGGDYGNQQNDNGDYGEDYDGDYGEDYNGDSENGDYDASSQYSEGNGNSYSEAFESYTHSSNKNNNDANQQQQYAQGNQNTQFYYSQMSNEDQGN